MLSSSNSTLFSSSSSSSSEKDIAATVENYQSRLQALQQKNDFIQGIKERFPSLTTLNVVSIGFGEHPIEIEALTRFLSSQGFTFNYYGFDIDAKAVQKCKAAHQKDNVKFFAMNAQDHVKMKEILAGQEVHLFIMRHPVLNYGRRDISDCFKTIFTETVPYILTPGGSLLVSIFTEHERATCDTLLKNIALSEVVELPEQEGVFWETEISGGLCGGDATYDSIICNLMPIETKLHAERYFFAVPNFQPSLLLQLEKTNSDLGVLNEENQSFVNNLQAFISVPIHLDGFHPMARGIRTQYILQWLAGIYASAGELNLTEELQNLKDKIDNASFINNYKNSDMSGIAHVLHDRLGNSATIVENHRELFKRFLLALNAVRQEIQPISDEALRYQHITQTLGLVASRILPNESMKAAPKVNAEERMRFLQFQN